MKGFYYFDKNHKWKFFVDYPFGFSEYDGFDDLIGDSWRLINDSVIEIDTYEYKIKEITNKVLVIDRGFRLDTFHAAPSYMIPPEFRHRW